MKIYVDMDGVLTNFEKKLSETINIPVSEAKGYNDPKMWDAIDKAGKDYWATMEWNPGGKEIWDFVKGMNPTILSSPSEDDSSRVGKREWVKEHLGEVPLILDKDKAKHAERDDILIDDLEKNIGPWVEAGGFGILHKDLDSTLEVLKKETTDLPASRKIDKVASILESKGFLKEAYELDILANTLEAFSSKPVVIDPYDAMVQKAVHALGPALKDVDVIKLETSCPGNKLAWVSNQDLIKGKPGKQRVIHLCLNKIKEKFKTKHDNSFTVTDPKEQKQMQEVIIQFLKDVVIPHETEHIHQEMEHGGDFGSGSEQKAEKAEDWKAVEDMGYNKK